MPDPPTPHPLARRDVLRLTGGTLAAATAVGTLGQARAATDHEWTAVESPTDRTLYDVVTTADGLVAVGGNGIILERGDDGWTVVTRTGPTNNGNNLLAAATTSDDERVWMAGASGVIGEYDPTTGHLTSYSAPDDVTNTFTDVTVSGPAGDATVYVTDGSGQVHFSEKNGAAGTWQHTTPGSGAQITAGTVTGETGWLADDNKDLFETTDGTTWNQLDAPEFGARLHGLDRSASDVLVAVGAGGTAVATLDGEWTQATVSGATLQAVEVAPCGCVHVVGGGGTVLHQKGTETSAEDLASWLALTPQSTPTGQNLHGITLGPPHAAVGASGTILER